MKKVSISYYSLVIAHKGYLLVGGVKQYKSSRFATREQAREYAHASCVANREAGRKCSGYVNVSTKRAEIDRDGELVT